MADLPKIRWWADIAPEQGQAPIITDGPRRAQVLAEILADYTGAIGWVEPGPTPALPDGDAILVFGATNTPAPLMDLARRNPSRVYAAVIPDLCGDGEHYEPALDALDTADDTDVRLRINKALGDFARLPDALSAWIEQTAETDKPIAAKRFADDLAPVLARLSPAESEAYIKRLSPATGLTLAAMKATVAPHLTMPAGIGQNDTATCQTHPTRTPDEPADGTLPEDLHLTDLGNAHRLKALHGRNIRYVAPWKRWLCWDGLRWAQDETLRIGSLAQDIPPLILRDASKFAKDANEAHVAAQEAYSQKDDALHKKCKARHEALKATAQEITKWARVSSSDNKCTAMIRQCRHLDGMSITPDRLDKNPFALVVQNGVVDVSTGEMTQPQRGDYLTKMAAVAYDEDAKCPRWERFVDEATCGDKSLAGYLQRAIGYSLTAKVSEQCIFFLLGGGANGKSTLIRVIRSIMGEYAKTANSQLLTAVYGQRNSQDVASLHGIRLAIASETNPGAQFDEQRVKELTENEVSARRLYENEWCFEPTHKIWLTANHLPSVKGTDDGFWRRMRLIEFRHDFRNSIGGAIPDYHEVLLREEGSGILNWALQGCERWLDRGLYPPQAVRDASDQYRRDEDKLGSFLRNTFVFDNEGRFPLRATYELYRCWSDRTTERAMTMIRFGIALGERGLTKKKTKEGWFWLGIRRPRKDEEFVSE